MQFLSDSQKRGLQSVFNKFHQTFTREIYAYKDDEITVLSENPDYIQIFGAENPQQPQIKRSLVKQSFKVRVFFPPKKQTQSDANFNDAQALKLRIDDNKVRIKVDKEAYEFLKQQKRIEIYGGIYEFDNSGQPIGLFDFDFFEFYLKKIS